MVLALIDISNIASLRASTQMGSRTAGYAGYLKLFGRCFTFRTPAARAIGAELYDPARKAPVPARGQARLVLRGLANA